MLALIATLGGLAVLALAETGGTGRSGGGDVEVARGTLSYEWDSGAAGWWDIGFPAAAFALLVAAALFQGARRAAAVALAFALLVAAPLVVVRAYSDKDGAGQISRAEGRSVTVGMTEGDVRRRLGPPIGHGEWHGGRRRADCLVYFTGDGVGSDGSGAFGFCLDGGRVIVRGESRW